MGDGTHHDEAMRLIEEAEHNAAGDRLISLAQVRATLAVADEVRALRETIAQLGGPLRPGG
jgi:hypothetical protein